MKKLSMLVLASMFAVSANAMNIAPVTRPIKEMLYKTAKNMCGLGTFVAGWKIWGPEAAITSLEVLNERLELATVFSGIYAGISMHSIDKIRNNARIAGAGSPVKDEELYKRVAQRMSNNGVVTRADEKIITYEEAKPLTHEDIAHSWVGDFSYEFVYFHNENRKKNPVDIIPFDEQLKKHGAKLLTTAQREYIRNLAEFYGKPLSEYALSRIVVIEDNEHTKCLGGCYYTQLHMVGVKPWVFDARSHTQDTNAFVLFHELSHFHHLVSTPVKTSSQEETRADMHAFHTLNCKTCIKNVHVGQFISDKEKSAKHTVLGYISHAPEKVKEIMKSSRIKYDLCPVCHPILYALTGGKLQSSSHTCTHK